MGGPQGGKMGDQHDGPWFGRKLLKGQAKAANRAGPTVLLCPLLSHSSVAEYVSAENLAVCLAQGKLQLASALFSSSPIPRSRESICTATLLHVAR